MDKWDMEVILVKFKGTHFKDKNVFLKLFLILVKKELQTIYIEH